jgi:hypothetical protein
LGLEPLLRTEDRGAELRKFWLIKAKAPPAISAKQIK